MSGRRDQHAHHHTWRCPGHAQGDADRRRGGLLRPTAMRAGGHRAHRGREPRKLCRRMPPEPGSESAPPRARNEPTATEYLGPRVSGVGWIGGSASAGMVSVGAPSVHNRVRTRPTVAANRLFRGLRTVTRVLSRATVSTSSAHMGCVSERQRSTQVRSRNAATTAVKVRHLSLCRVQSGRLWVPQLLRPVSGFCASTG